MHATAPGSGSRPSTTGTRQRPLAYNPFATQPLASSAYASSPLVDPQAQRRARDGGPHAAPPPPRPRLSSFTRVVTPPPLDRTAPSARLVRGGTASAGGRRPSHLALTAPAPASAALTADLRGPPQHVLPRGASTLTLSTSQHAAHYAPSPYLRSEGPDQRPRSHIGATRPTTASAPPRRPSGYRWTFLTEEALADGRRLRASTRPPKARSPAPEADGPPRRLWEGPAEGADADHGRDGLPAPSPGATRGAAAKTEAAAEPPGEPPIPGMPSFEQWLETVVPPAGSGDGDDGPRDDGAPLLGTVSYVRAEKMARAYEALLAEMADALPYTRQEDRERLLRLKNDCVYHSLRLQCAYRHLPARVVPAEAPPPCLRATPPPTAATPGHRPPAYPSMMEPMAPAWERRQLQETASIAVLAQVKDPHAVRAPPGMTQPYSTRPDMRRLLEEHAEAAGDTEELERARERSFYETLNRYNDQTI